MRTGYHAEKRARELAEHAAHTENGEALRLLVGLLDEARATRETPRPGEPICVNFDAPVPPRTLAALEAHIARVEGERDAALFWRDQTSHFREIAAESYHACARELWADAADALRYGHAECERLRAVVEALAAAVDPARLHVTMDRKHSQWRGDEVVTLHMNARVYDNAMAALKETP